MNTAGAYRIGLTGGIACGKTVVSRAFADLGVPVIDTDELSREVVERGSPLLARLAEAFGEDILRGDGTLDRRALRLKVFSGERREELLPRLNALMHPAIIEALQARYRAVSFPYVVIVIPLLFEHHLEGLCDRVLVVDAREQTQLARLTERDGIDPETAASMIASQVSRACRRGRADDLIESDRLSIEETRQTVIKLHGQYLDLAQHHNS